jgi:hypothetical protein
MWQNSNTYLGMTVTNQNCICGEVSKRHFVCLISCLQTWLVTWAATSFWRSFMEEGLQVVLTCVGIFLLQAGQHQSFGSSPATSFNLASPPSLPPNINPSPSMLPHPSPGGLLANSPSNPLHVPSPAGLMPTSSPGPCPAVPVGHSPAGSFMGQPGMKMRMTGCACSVKCGNCCHFQIAVPFFKVLGQSRKNRNSVWEPLAADLCSWKWLVLFSSLLSLL